MIRTLPLLVIPAAMLAQVADAPAQPVAGIPVNYTESLAGTPSLPDPLKFANGKPVRSAKDWAKRRAEIVKLFEEHQFGRAPKRAANLKTNAFDPGSPAFDGKATRRQTTLYFTPDGSGPRADLLLYLPAAATKPVPVLLNLSFSANSSTVADPGIRPSEVWNREKQRVPAAQGRGIGRQNPVPYLERGIGFATIYYGDIDPDFDGGVQHGVRALFLKPGETKPGPGEWGTIAAWAWGASRALDYLGTVAGVDAKRVAVMGVSRLGKTVLWTGASDPRFAAVIASCSGEGGASLSRRNYGERIKHLAVRYGYQFAANYANYGDAVDSFPVDSHMLVSLIAPRPLLLQTGDTDRWSDPMGEHQAAIAATPVYKLLGATGVDAGAPVVGQLTGGALSYYMHSGGHGTIPSDHDVFLRFLRTHLQVR